MKYKYCLIDVDNTLLDFCYAEKHAHKLTCETFNIPWSNELYAVYHKINDNWWKRLELGEFTKDQIIVNRHKDYFKYCGVEFDPLEFNKSYVLNLSKGKKLMPFANELVKLLYDAGLKLYIATNGIAKVQYSRLDDQEFMKYISGLLISEELGSQKPDVAFFKNASIKAGVDFSKNTIIIGDSLTSDIKGGINYGIDTLWINVKNEENPYGDKITYIINRLEEIPCLLLK
ncbi:MAG: YjjG family noncanonical pyrimidine nucleotidase [Clostridia bacterium]|nr:YjjG family noncanonical pyrimidine nucleotidase [Clostridia bacterium]